MQPGDVVKKVLVELPGDLLGDHGHRPEVIAGPTARVVVRWLVGLLFVGLLFGLVGWSFTTSPELTSSIQVARFYQPTLDQLQTWEQKNETFQCLCTAFRSVIQWSDIVSESTWQQLEAMQRPHGPADQPPYNSFCVAHVLLGGDHPGCQTVRVHGFDTPDDAADRANITTTYPGSMLQAPTCRAIAAKLMWTNRTGLASSVLQSRTALNNTVQNNLANTIFGTAAEMHANMMDLWSLELDERVVAPNCDGFYSNTGHACKLNNTCANELCLISWFMDFIHAIHPNYTAYFEACNPQYCDVVSPKSLVTKVVSFVATLGGLWGPFSVGAVLLWLLLRRLPCLAAPHKQQQLQLVDLQVVAATNYGTRGPAPSQLFTSFSA